MSNEPAAAFEWCEECQSYHHPRNPTCYRLTGRRHHKAPPAAGLGDWLVLLTVLAMVAGLAAGC